MEALRALQRKVRRGKGGARGACALLGLLHGLGCGTEPEDTLQRVAAVLCGARSAELKAELRPLLAADAVVEQIDPKMVLLGREEVVERAHSLRRLMPNCSVELRLSSTGSDDEAAWAVGEVNYSSSQAFDLHARTRPVRLRLHKQGKVLLLSQVWIGPRERRLPEARP